MIAFAPPPLFAFSVDGCSRLDPSSRPIPSLYRALKPLPRTGPALPSRRDARRGGNFLPPSVDDQQCAQGRVPRRGEPGEAGGRSSGAAPVREGCLNRGRFSFVPPVAL